MEVTSSRHPKEAQREALEQAMTAVISSVAASATNHDLLLKISIR